MASVVFLKAGTTSWKVPSDWPGTGVVECIGPGGNGYQDRGGPGGGGGAYAKLNALSATAGATLSCQVGAGGSQQNTWLGSTTTVLAAAGTKGTSTSSSTPGFGGKAANSVGDVKFSGGDGGNGGTYGGGGGGAAGPSGAGTIGTNPNGGAANNNTAAGGLGATNATAAGNPGVAADVYTQTSNSEKAGPGPGGGGSRGSNGGAGGTYGGGGGAGNAAAAGGTGGAGLIVVTYEPVVVPGAKTFLVGAVALAQRYIGALKPSRYAGTSLEWSQGDGWKWERAVTLNNGSAPAASGLQSVINLTSSNFDFASARSDGADIRILDTDKATPLPFWIEAFDKTAQRARVWFKCDVPASASKTVYLYSGKDDATPASNGAAVFEFFEDFTGKPGWNTYAVTNPVLGIPDGASIVGEPMIIPPDALTNELGFSYFVSVGNNCYVGYATIGTDGKTIADKGKAIDYQGTAYQRVLKAHIIYWAPANCYYAAVSCENDGQNRQIRLFKSTTSRQGPWTDVKMLLTGDPSLVDGQGNQIERTFVDCPFFLYDGAVLRLYYSANESQNNEPLYFCGATFADGPESALTRYPGNPIARPNPAVSWANKALGGTAVDKLANGKFRFTFNAFTDGEVSQMGQSISDDGWSLTIAEADRITPLGPPGSWDRTRQYRPSVPYKVADGIERILYNALGDKEQIGLAEKGQTIDRSRWTPFLQGAPRMNFVNGALKMGETQPNNPGAFFMMTSNYVPPAGVVVETRARLDAVFDGQFAEFAFFMLSEDKLFPGNSYNNQFLFLVKYWNEIRHQNRSGGGWGGEDTIASFPPTGTFQRYQMAIGSSSTDYRVLADDGSVIGQLLGNTDAPQAPAFPLAIGGHGAEVSFDFMIARKLVSSPPAVSVGAAASVSKNL